MIPNGDTNSGPEFWHEMGALLLSSGVDLEDKSACIRALVEAGYRAAIVAAQVDLAVKTAKDTDALFNHHFPEK